jgi:hypothetical protein
LGDDADELVVSENLRLFLNTLIDGMSEDEWTPEAWVEVMEFRERMNWRERIREEDTK